MLSKALTGPTRVNAAITRAAQKYGQDPLTMRVIAQIESGGDPAAKNPRSSAGGLFQFIDSTARSYGLENRFDENQAADAAARLLRDNASGLRSVLGRDPTPGELYLAHQQGLGGARRLLGNPSAKAVDIVGRDAVRLNGGDENMTALEFANIWMRKADNLAGVAARVPVSEVSAGAEEDVLAGGEAEDTEPEYMTPADILAAVGGTAEQPTVAEAYMTPAQILAQSAEAPLVPFGPIEATERPFFDIAESVTRPGRELLEATNESIMGRGPSVAAQMLPEGFPMREGFGRALDIPLSVAGGLNVAGAGLVGGLSDVAEGLGMPRAGQFARDVLAMPEAFAGSPTSFGRTGPLVRSRPDAPEAPEVSLQGAGETVRLADDVAEGPQPRVSDLRRLIVDASRNNTAARKELARKAKFNPEAAAAADRLGLELPTDVFADDQATQTAMGMLRGVRDSDASIEWGEQFRAAQVRAAQIIDEAGSGGDLSSQAETVKRSLKDSIDTLQAQASPIFDEVKEKIPTSARIRPTNSIKLINEVAEELGGISRFKGPMRSLLDAVTSEDGMTYGAIQLEIRQLARGAFKNQGPYADADQRIAQRVWAALKDDQRNFVASEAGEDAAKRLDQANSLWSQARDIEKSLVAGFGKSTEGSIANKLTSALRQGSKGDIAGLNAVLSVVPDNLKRETILSGIEELSKSTSGQPGFSFPRFAKTWRGLRDNKEVFKPIAKALGPESVNLLNDLQVVATRIDRASSSIDRTGRANQVLQAEGLISRVLNSSGGQVVKGGLAGAAATRLAGPLVGGAVAVTAANTKFGRNRAAAASRVFRSSEFRALAEEVARSGPPQQRSVRRAANSKSFREWAKVNNIENPEAWLVSAIAASQAPQVNEAENAR